MQFIIAILIAIIPAILMCVYIYYEDRYEKESIPFLLMLFALGILCAVFSNFVKSMLQLFWNYIFSDHISYSRDGILFISNNVRWLYNLLLAVFSYAVSDIAFIVATLFLVTFNNKNFNSLFDGIVYSVYMIIGFTLVEVLLFGYLKGWDLVAMKCLTTLPMRMFTGVIMGYYYSQVKIYHKAHLKEIIYVTKLGEKAFFRKRKWLIFTILLPWIAWGVFEYATLMDSPLWRYFYYLVLMILYVYAIRKITKVANDDALFDDIANNMLDEKYKIDNLQDKN